MLEKRSGFRYRFRYISAPAPGVPDFGIYFVVFLLWVFFTWSGEDSRAGLAVSKKLQKCIACNVGFCVDFLRSTLDPAQAAPRAHGLGVFAALPWASFAQVIRTIGVSPKGRRAESGAEKLRKQERGISGF